VIDVKILPDLIKKVNKKEQDHEVSLDLLGELNRRE
jgi:hypothetical protein